MKRLLWLAALLFGSALILQAQDSNPSNDTNQSPKTAQSDMASRNLTAAQQMKGDAEIRSDLMLSFEDHNVLGVNVTVTDNAIDLSGKVSNKDEQRLVRDLAAAYLDGRKLHDHTSR